MTFNFSLKELLIMCFVFSFFMPMCLGIRESIVEQSNRTKCKANLGVIGKSMEIYYFNNRRNSPRGYIGYPNASGGGFIARLYQAGLIYSTEYYICPSTEDATSGEKLMNLTAEDPDNINATSYSGRKNKKEGKYPALFPPTPKDCYFFVTPIAADDTQGESNHLYNYNLLMWEGNVDHVSLNDEKYVQSLLDPLTN